MPDDTTDPADPTTDPSADASGDPSATSGDSGSDPSTDTASGDPSTDTSGTDTSGTDTSGTDTSGTDSSGTDTSGTDTSGADTSGTDTSGADTSGADTSGDGASDPGATDTSATDTSTATDESAATDPASDTSGTSSATGAQADDPGKPYLFVDVFSGDDGRLVGKKPDWSAVVAAPGYVGAIIKAWDGTTFHDGGWFARHWQAVRDAGGDRYGRTWFRGAYLFLEFHADGAAQADAYLDAVDAAGGWGDGDIIPIIDVEQGGEGRPAANGKPAVPPHPNRSATKAQVVACATACANRIRERTQRRVMLYGRGAMRDLSIVDTMGCDVVWNPAYTPTMVVHGLEAWKLEDIVLWQYAGDGKGAIASLPHTVPGFGPCDLSVYVKGAQSPTIAMVRESLLS